MVEAQTQMPAGLLPLASQPAIVASRWLVVASLLTINYEGRMDGRTDVPLSNPGTATNWNTNK